MSPGLCRAHPKGPAKQADPHETPPSEPMKPAKQAASEPLDLAAAASSTASCHPSSSSEIRRKTLKDFLHLTSEAFQGPERLAPPRSLSPSGAHWPPAPLHRAAYGSDTCLAAVLSQVVGEEGARVAHELADVRRLATRGRSHVEHHLGPHAAVSKPFHCTAAGRCSLQVGSETLKRF